MNKTLAMAMLATAAFANPGMGANGYSRGIPPTTQNCNAYPNVAAGSTNYASQDMAWGLVVDREFGGCRCADEDEMEFQPDSASYMDNKWGCRCLNSDLYLSQPTAIYQC